MTQFKKGDKVAGFTYMTSDDKYGAYAEYTCCPEWSTYRVTDDTPFEVAATTVICKTSVILITNGLQPLAGITAAIGMFAKLKLPTPKNPAPLGPSSGCYIRSIVQRRQLCRAARQTRQSQGFGHRRRESSLCQESRRRHRGRLPRHQQGPACCPSS